MGELSNVNGIKESLYKKHEYNIQAETFILVLFTISKNMVMGTYSSKMEVNTLEVLSMDQFQDMGVITKVIKK